MGVSGNTHRLDNRHCSTALWSFRIWLCLCVVLVKPCYLAVPRGCILSVRWKRQFQIDFINMVSSIHVEPVSRSDQYKRVMKPLLERKRRARINRCLDELRDLLVSVLQAEGEAVTRLEKADILELTVRHVRRLSQRRRLALPTPGSKHQENREDVAKFQEGFVAAAQQVRSFLLTTNSLEPSVSTRLLTHLTSCATSITPKPPLPPSNCTPPVVSTVNNQVPIQVAKPAVASRPHTNSPVVASPANSTSVSPSNALAPFLTSTGSQSFQKSSPPPPPQVRLHQSVISKSLPAYQVNAKINLAHQPLIDLSNHKSPACVYTPPAFREPPFPDRKVAPSPFIDVVTTENDSPDFSKQNIKSEFSPRPVQDSNASLQLRNKYRPEDSSSIKIPTHLYSPGGENKSDSERSCFSPIPQDLSMKKNVDESGSSWRPW